MKRTIISLVLTAFAIAAVAQEYSLPSKKKRAVYGTDFYVSPSRYDYTPAASDITADANTDYERAEDLYDWICNHIMYDPSASIRTADECWEKRMGVCQGYCELYYRMAQSIGLKCRLIFGKSKSPEPPRRPKEISLSALTGTGTAGDVASSFLQESNPSTASRIVEHTWLVVETERGTVLMDPTWGAGTWMRGQFLRLQDSSVWFDVDPCWMIFTHFPSKSKRQYISNPLSEEEFLSLPYTTPMVEMLGVTADYALEELLSGGVPYPTIPAMNALYASWLDLKGIPSERILYTDKTYTFKITKDDTEGMTLSLSNEGDVYKEEKWTREGDTFTIEVKPRRTGSLRILLNDEGDGKVPVHKVIVEYQVKSGD